MDISRFKDQHVDILSRIARLRELSHAGAQANASDIAQQIEGLSDIVIRHLAVEDRILYPAVQKATDPALAQMGKAYQKEMEGIANAYIAFSRQWSEAAQIRANPEKFRAAANTVLKTVWERMQKENREFYPAVEAM